MSYLGNSRTQSWCFVPLLYSALGRVPAKLAGDATSTPEQIEILGGRGAGDLGEDSIIKPEMALSNPK